MTHLQAWETPSDYAGFDPVGHFGVITIHRDSLLLDRVNWDVAAERMAKAAGLDAIPTDTDAVVYQWEASHWVVGWVRYMMVRPDAPQVVLDEVEAIRSELDDYPILDDDRYNAEEWDAMQAYWARESVRDRADWIKGANKYGDTTSIFAARRDYIPNNDGYLDDMMREGL